MVETVVMIGAGDCYNRNFKEALDILGPCKSRIVIDRNFLAVSQAGALGIQADAGYLPFDLNHQDTLAIIGIPDHLPVIKELVSVGVKKIIVEKPLVNNTRELNELEQLQRRYPDLKIYPLDYYLQKTMPLGILTGKIGPADPRFSLVKRDIAELMQSKIGQIIGIDIELVEGGNLGIPSLEKRPWLEKDPLTGGMLLDLGTHAFGPLFYYGLIKPAELEIISVSQKILSPERTTLIPKTGDKPEIYVEVKLSTKNVKVNFRAGKVPEEGRWSNMIIHGENGKIALGLKRGDTLIAGLDPYMLALQEAASYFRGEIEIGDNYQTMKAAILLIDKIKSVSCSYKLSALTIGSG